MFLEERKKRIRDRMKTQEQPEKRHVHVTLTKYQSG